MSGSFEVTFLGTNGSCAYNSGKRTKYGTNTLCVAVKAGDSTLLFDSGSGICGFPGLVDYQNKHISLLFSHYHIDHFSGLLFYAQLFDKDMQFDIFGSGLNEDGFYSIVDHFLSPPLHPVGIDALQAKIDFHTIVAGQEIPLGPHVTVRTYGLSHPGGAIGYRVEYDGKAFCYCTDVELDKHQDDAGFLDFTRDADLLVLDAFFDDGKVIPDWGHSSWRECAEWASRVGAKRLALFHYGFMLTDSEIDAMEEKAQTIFPGAFAAADHMRVVLL